MHFLAKPVGITDYCLALTGIGLACGSMYLFAYMTTTPHPAAAIYGREYLSIYSRPKIPLSPTAKRLAAKNLDYAPVGNIRAPVDKSYVKEFELLDATASAATLRTSQGRILHAAPGTILSGGVKVLAIQQHGANWIVRTTAGVIGRN